MLRVEECEEAVKQKRVTYRCCGVMLPDPGALQHITLFDGFGLSCGVTIRVLLSSSRSELGLEVICICLHNVNI